jgi:hypothetical protein
MHVMPASVAFVPTYYVECLSSRWRPIPLIGESNKRIRIAEEEGPP